MTAPIEVSTQPDTASLLLVGLTLTCALASGLLLAGGLLSLHAAHAQVPPTAAEGALAKSQGYTAMVQMLQKAQAK